jgi:hypothetical protein
MSLERRHASRWVTMRHAETPPPRRSLGYAGRAAARPGRLAGRPGSSVLHAVAEERIDRPDAPAATSTCEQRAMNSSTIHPEAAVELVARLEDLQRSHIAAHVS